MSIPFEEIKAAGKVIPFEDARNLLTETEPLGQYEFETNGESQKVNFQIPLNWVQTIKDIPDSGLSGATFSIGGKTHELTKEAILSATSAIGMNPTFSQKTPAQIVQSALNHHANNGNMKADRMKLLTTGEDEKGVIFTKASLGTFSNLTLIDITAEKLADRFGIPVTDLYVDYKLYNSLSSTSFRLIVPEPFKSIQSERNTAQGPDDWSLGIQFTNSLAGDKPKSLLSVSGYMFAWWCTNGAISQHAQSGNYSRKTGGQNLDDVIGWLDASVENILDILPEELDEIEALTQISLAGELTDTVRDIFDRFSVPISSREGIMDALVESSDLTGYGLMNAITQAANNSDWDDHTTKHVMGVGGAIPHILTTRCGSCHRLTT